ncbi:MAG: SIS domain-containing protein [Deinococcales bacterium]
MGAEVERLLEQIDPDQFDATLSHLRDAQRTWFFSGQGRSGLVASMVAMRFMQLGRPVHVQGEATAPAIREGDGLLVISGSAETPVSLHHARVAKEHGASVVLVTHEPSGPLARMAEAVLVLPAEHSHQFGGSLFEQGALLALDAIVLALARESHVAFDDMMRRHTNLR